MFIVGMVSGWLCPIVSGWYGSVWFGSVDGVVVGCWFMSIGLKAEKPSAKTQVETPNKRKKKRKQDAYIYFNSISDNNRLKRVQNAQFKRFLFVQV